MELLLLTSSNSMVFEMELILIFGIHILTSLFRYNTYFVYRHLALITVSSCFIIFTVRVKEKDIYFLICLGFTRCYVNLNNSVGAS